jgi:hypothetical protein
MNPFIGKFISASTEWLMSQEGRRMLAKTLRFCRARYGRPEAVKFRDHLLWLGCLYPQLLGNH